jgi:RimJ/RimL family protein N-acetyltransferase
MRDMHPRYSPAMPPELRGRGPTLRTDRLVLRPWQAADLEPFATMNADPEVMRYFPRPLAREESDEFAGRIDAAFDELGYGLWVVELRDAPGFLGFTGLAVHRFEAPFMPATEVGWRFRAAAWGRGYATEAAREALRFGFDVAGLPEILSWTSVLNERSIRVMERLGMHRDPSEDFDHPRVPVGHPLRRHVLYRLRAEEFRGGR